MRKIATTIRMDAKDKRGIVKIAKRYAISFSDVMNILVQALLEDEIAPGILKYPPKYLKELERESKETMRLYREGKLKSYSSVKEFFDDMLGSSRKKTPFHAQQLRKRK